MKRMTILAIALLIGRAGGREILTAGSGDFSAHGYHLSFTLGEPVTESFAAEASILTQGFRQPEIMTGTLARFDRPALGAKSNREPLVIEVFSPRGRRILRRNYREGDHFRMKSVSSGYYVVRITNRRGKKQYQFNLLKVEQNGD
jgi:hypothetical protein